jgi:hypothetical protein
VITSAKFRRLAWSLALFLIPAFGAARYARAEHPPAPKLLPHDTLAILRIPDTQEMLSRFRETAIGRIGQDEEIKPLVSQLYAAVQDAWKQIEDRVGVPIDQILRLPQGEVCLAVLPMAEGPPAVVFFIDTGDQVVTARKLLESGERALLENGGQKASETIEDVPVAIYSGPGGNSVAQFEKDGTIVVASRKEIIAPLLKSWSGQSEEKTLADNEKFVSIMNRCGAGDKDRPHVTWYIDPIEIAKRLLRNTPASLSLALFPVLGLDGIKAVGGSMIFSTEEFDDVQHVHLLLDNPRAGIVDLLNLGGGDTSPENWVPGDVVTYSTFHWKFQETFDKGAKLYNSLSNEGAFEAEVRTRLSENIGIDVQKELLPLLDGRVTLANWIERPIRLNSQTNIIGIKLTDPAAAKALLDKVAAKFADNLERKSFGGTTYWVAALPQGRGPGLRVRLGPGAAPGEEPGANLRPPEGCICILGDYLIFTDSSAALHQCIVTASDTKRSLANDLEFKLIASKIKRQVGGESAGFVQFNRPEEAMRFVYDMATGGDAKRFLERQAEDNPFLRDVDKALKDHPLPPFSVIAKYLAPGGGMIVNDETGFHYMTFTLKRKTP